MLTHDELIRLLTDHYTSEELCDILILEPCDLMEASVIIEKIAKKHDDLVTMIQEDTGYGLTSDDD